jgi:gamma-glutamyltranspeptidase
MHHQALPDSIRLEQGGFQPAAIAELERLGHGIQYRGGWGDVEAIIRMPSGWEGVSDPRGGGGGSGY